MKHSCFNFSFFLIIRGDTHITSTLRKGGGGGGWGGEARMRCYWTKGSGVLASVLDVQSLFFLLKKTGFAL